MADVQLEHGHVRIANRLYEAMLDAEFTGAQMRILIALIRLTYGWRRKTVTIALVELAAYARLSPAATRRDTKREAAVSGSFRRALYELIEEGVVLRLEQAGGSQLGTYAIQKDFTKWGRFGVTEGRLASIWRARPQSADSLIGDALPDPAGSPSPSESNEEGDPMGTDGVTPQGQEGRPHRVTPTGSKCDTPPQLAGRKDRKDKKDRTTSSRKGRATWMTPFADAWKEQYGGKMPMEPHARPLREAFESLGAEESLRRWKIYLAQALPQYASAARFAATLAAWASLASSNGNGVDPAAIALFRRYATHGLLTRLPRDEYVRIGGEMVGAGFYKTVDEVLDELRITQPWTLNDCNDDRRAAKIIADRLAAARTVRKVS